MKYYIFSTVFLFTSIVFNDGVLYGMDDQREPYGYGFWARPEGRSRMIPIPWPRLVAGSYCGKSTEENVFLVDEAEVLQGSSTANSTITEGTEPLSIASSSAKNPALFLIKEKILSDLRSRSISSLKEPGKVQESVTKTEQPLGMCVVDPEEDVYVSPLKPSYLINFRKKKADSKAMSLEEIE